MGYGIEIVISAIILVLILFLTGYIMRKKYYKEVDQLETRKLELMNRPVVEELAKIKKLNMTGQTEELFEKWRQEWDEIVAIRFPNIDEMLFNIEESTDKYKFKQAKLIQTEVDDHLLMIEADIEKILAELATLVGSEEKNRQEIESLQETYAEHRKHVLAHRHIFGVAADSLDEQLKEIHDKLKAFSDLTNNGNYLEARELVLQISEEIDLVSVRIEKIPSLLTECQTVLPNQLEELISGYQEMDGEGYILDHLQIEQQVSEIETDLQSYREYLKETEVEEVEVGVKEAKEKVDLLYDLLEKEVYSKHYVLNENEKAEHLLDDLKLQNGSIKKEAEIVQNSYQLLEHDLEIPRKFEKNLQQLSVRFDVLKAKIGDKITSFSLLSEELKEIDEKLKEMQAEQAEYLERLQRLRKDEIEARETLKHLHRKINDITRKVKQSHMPGLPADFESLYDQADERIKHVYTSLEESPLNMKSVQKALYDARDTVDHLFTKTEEYIETAQLAEKVIQYGNRYRRQHSRLRDELDQAEQAFRRYEYMAALEQAATAVEEVEPGALKRIEDMYKDKLLT